MIIKFICISSFYDLRLNRRVKNREGEPPVSLGVGTNRAEQRINAGDIFLSGFGHNRGYYIPRFSGIDRFLDIANFLKRGIHLGMYVSSAYLVIGGRSL